MQNKRDSGLLVAVLVLVVPPATASFQLVVRASETTLKFRESHDNNVVAFVFLTRSANLPAAGGTVSS
ncbi:hypothetical protein [Allomuricauda sp. SCSIO 65647]|uniref:hypothetical protein n=1 Tax=Allomuricauda sp. SCSIO 65647 TaxID=2908843 RepID=UPI001F3DF496|nr:hypothetical protein [Muricauda sp. SCSIO 65647]UJH66385.1 hypothetical protein L0P89_10440 [Muricauda sp. SCSIO 65647]